MNINLEKCREEDLPKILDIYTEAFPKEERKPFDVICEHNRIGKAELQSVLIDGEVSGMVHTYLFDGFAMVDYFAIHKDKRNLGAGTNVIDLIRKKYTGYKIYLEIEICTTMTVQMPMVTTSRPQPAMNGIVFQMGCFCSSASLA